MADAKKKKFVKYAKLTPEQEERRKIDKILDQLDASRPVRMGNMSAKASRRYATRLRGF